VAGFGQKRIVSISSIEGAATVKTDAFKWGNGFGCACGIAWAYTSYKYNWLNVGGGKSDLQEFWIAASGVVPYLALIFWLSAISLAGARGLAIASESI
jgi:hypothetical protein